jgi:predicted nucleic acid-binding protein
VPVETIYTSDLVCIDASVVLALVLDEPESDLIELQLKKWASKNVALISSFMLAVEVTSVIRNRVFLNKIDNATGNEAYDAFSVMLIKTFGGNEFVKLAWLLAAKYNLPRTYDMQYLAVAEMKECEFWTADKRLVNSLRGKNSRVKFVGDL